MLGVPPLPVPLSDSWAVPSWAAPPNVRAVTTTRTGGYSKPPYQSLNLASHVGDRSDAVRANRRWLKDALQLPSEPIWLRQVHGTRIVHAGSTEKAPQADGSFATQPGVVCTVLTADCLPVLLCDRKGTRVAAAHAGWRGLSDGIIEAAVDSLGTSAEDLLAWLGPAIGPAAFEVGNEVRMRFLTQNQRATEAFRPSASGRWMADIYELARLRLRSRGVHQISGGGLCTLTDEARFFSYRRNRTTGRMATLIWLEG